MTSGSPGLLLIGSTLVFGGALCLSALEDSPAVIELGQRYEGTILLLLLWCGTFPCSPTWHPGCGSLPRWTVILVAAWCRLGTFTPSVRITSRTWCPLGVGLSCGSVRGAGRIATIASPAATAAVNASSRHRRSPRRAAPKRRRAAPRSPVRSRTTPDTMARQRLEARYHRRRAPTITSAGPQRQTTSRRHLENSPRPKLTGVVARPTTLPRRRSCHSHLPVAASTADTPIKKPRQRGAPRRHLVSTHPAGAPHDATERGHGNSPRRCWYARIISVDTATPSPGMR